MKNEENNLKPTIDINNKSNALENIETIIEEEESNSDKSRIKKSNKILSQSTKEQTQTNQFSRIVENKMENFFQRDKSI